MLNREEELRFCRARRGAIALDFQALNPEQRQAALATEGPLLLLAGAGSGKTTVLINRVDNLLTFGRGSDTDEVPEWAGEEGLAFLEPIGTKGKDVCLTDAGQALAEGTVARLIAVEDAILGSWPAEDVEKYLSLAEQYLTAFREKAKHLGNR